MTEFETELTHEQIVTAIFRIRPGAEFSLSGHSLTWLDKTKEPTLTEIEAAWNADPIIPPPPVQRYQVNAERDRRIASGFSFNGMIFQSRPDDLKRIAANGTLALAAIMSGAQTNFTWIAADNTLVPMDAQTATKFSQAAAEWETAHMLAGRVLKKMNPVPQEYTDDAYWPTLAK